MDCRRPLIAACMFLGCAGWARVSDAALGDLLRTVVLPPGAQCGNGSSAAVVPGSLVGFPAIPTLLVTSCYQGSDLFYVNPANSMLVKTVTTSPTAPAGWGSLAYRADHGDITGCGNDATNHPIYSINPNTGAASFLRPGAAVSVLRSGVAVTQQATG